MNLYTKKRLVSSILILIIVSSFSTVFYIKGQKTTNIEEPLENKSVKLIHEMIFLEEPTEAIYYNFTNANILFTTHKCRIDECVKGHMIPSQGSENEVLSIWNLSGETEELIGYWVGWQFSFGIDSMALSNGLIYLQFTHICFQHIYNCSLNYSGGEKVQDKGIVYIDMWLDGNGFYEIKSTENRLILIQENNVEINAIYYSIDELNNSSRIMLDNLNNNFTENASLVASNESFYIKEFGFYQEEIVLFVDFCHDSKNCTIEINGESSILNKGYYFVLINHDFSDIILLEYTFYISPNFVSSIVFHSPSNFSCIGKMNLSSNEIFVLNYADGNWNDGIIKDFDIDLVMEFDFELLVINNWGDDSRTQNLSIYMAKNLTNIKKEIIVKYSGLSIHTVGLTKTDTTMIMCMIIGYKGGVLSVEENNINIYNIDAKKHEYKLLVFENIIKSYL